jgi:hypothetical protein
LSVDVLNLLCALLVLGSLVGGAADPAQAAARAKVPGTACTTAVPDAVVGMTTGGPSATPTSGAIEVITGTSRQYVAESSFGSVATLSAH